MTVIIKELILRGIVSSDPLQFDESACFLSILPISNKFNKENTQTSIFDLMISV